MAEYPRIPIFSMQVGQYPHVLSYWFRKLAGHRRVFSYDGRELEYFEHPYNRTWVNERAVEVPIIWELMQKYAPADVLEIGNVIPHYYRFGHTVVDKYEHGRGVIRQDVADLSLSGRYSLIVSISTLEHVGWDETPRAPGKHLLALAALKRHLAPDGLLVVTLPIGYNPGLDDDLFAERLGFDDVHFFKRITQETWMHAQAEDVRDSKYGVPFRAANAVTIGFLRNHSGS